MLGSKGMLPIPHWGVCPVSSLQFGHILPSKPQLLAGSPLLSFSHSLSVLGPQLLNLGASSSLLVSLPLLLNSPDFLLNVWTSSFPSGPCLIQSPMELSGKLRKISHITNTFSMVQIHSMY